MNVVMLLPSLDTFPSASTQWDSLDPKQDRLLILSPSPTLAQPSSHECMQVHELEQLITYTEPRDLRRGILSKTFDWLGKLSIFCPALSGAYSFILWKAFLSNWESFRQNMQSLDPDVIDLRHMPNGEALRAKLQSESPNVLVLSGKSKSTMTVDTSWRRYDPDIKVSIVLPVYNGTKYLRRSMESCLAQTHRNLELIVVDDCSTDDTPSIIRDYAKKDPRVISVRNERNMRLPASLNIGFARASGELQTWTSHDNYYAPDAVETLVRYLSTYPNMDFVYTAFHFIDENDRVDPHIMYLPQPCALRYLNVVGPCFLYRKNVSKTVGDYRVEMEYEEDYDYWVRVYNNGFKMTRLHLPLYSYRRHPESMWTYYRRHPELWGKVRRKHFSG